MRVSFLTTTLDSRSLECENTYTPARRVALFCEHFVAPTASAGCVFFSMKSFFQQVLINMIFTSFEISSHFFLPAACSVVVYLVHTVADLFHSQEIALLRMLSGTAALSAALEKLPRRSLVVRSASTLFMFRVSIPFCNPNLSVTSAAVIALAKSGPPTSHTVKLKFLYSTFSTLKSIVGMIVSAYRLSLFSPDGLAICLLLLDMNSFVPAEIPQNSIAGQQRLQISELQSEAKSEVLKQSRLS